MNRKSCSKNSNSESKQKWKHPGGKLRELGAESLSDSELLSILISSGIKGRSAEIIAGDILKKFTSFKGLADVPLENFLDIKGLSDVKIIRIAAALEIAKRCVDTVIQDLKKDKELRKETFGE